ncbi:hypothetical protein EG329_008282 [Mollisiaceae sp. DMI_Dod_QoI]|nr:hypothetical protein EG329_008282 [Helotiales sp. DMI_Dod_QoI]
MAKKKGKAPNTASISSNSDIDEMTSALAQTNLGDESPPRLNHTRLTRKTIVREFERYFGDTSKLDNWQRLCGDVGLDDDLPSISKCRVALKKVWVNIYDLVDAVRNDTCPPKRFRSQQALANYTVREEKIFPRQKAKDGGPVRALLAHIF